MSDNIIFMGTSKFAVPILEKISKSKLNISVVYTQPPQKSHRGQKINKSPIQVISETLNIYFRCPENCIFLISARLWRSQDVFLADFGAQLRKANDCNAVVRSTLLFFFISGGPLGMNLRNFEYLCMSISSDQLY